MSEIEDVPLDGMPEEEETTVQAPYGLRSDGTPRRKPGPPKGTRPGSKPAAPRRRPGPPRAAAPKVDYRPAVAGLLQLPAFGCTMVAKFTGRKEFLADAAAITLHTPKVAQAAHDTAMTQASFAAVLDRVLAVGPWGALLGAGMPLATQIAANHGLIPATPEMGIYAPDDLIQAAMPMAA